MGDNELLNLHSRHTESYNKYTYFLLAVTASAVAFAIQKTDNSPFSWSLLPLGISVVLWGASFACGTKNLILVHTALGANYGLLQLKKGVHPDQPDHPDYFDAAINGVTKALNQNVDTAQKYAIWQYRCLIVGALFFILWHLLEMYLRTKAA